MTPDMKDLDEIGSSFKFLNNFWWFIFGTLFGMFVACCSAYCFMSFVEQKWST